MTVPTHLTRYQCEDYFSSGYAERGYWDEVSQLRVILPKADIHELPEQEFLVIGRAGVDGIVFGYRAGQSGLWAYYPIGREVVPLATSVDELVRKWLNGEITV